ncbi:MAG: two-component regulator propeller domain-containing protein, partial [Mariniphaga sp.]
MGNKRKFAFRYCVYRLLLLFALIGRGSAFADDFQIKKISPEGGFTFDAINTVCEDKYGFIWFGSNSGVYRYNSVETVKYINSPDDPTSLPGNTVRSLYLDLNGQMWVSTNRGLCVFDYQCECFRKYVLHDANGNPSAINVLQVFQTDDGTYWLVDNAGIATIDFNTRVVNYLSLPDTQNDLVRVAVRNKNENRIWLGGTTGGIFYCDPPYKKINFFARTRNENVLSILPDENDIWVGYEWGGADLFTKSGDLTVHYSDDLQGRNKIPSSRVRTIFKYKNKIWLGTFKGIASISSGETEIIEKERYPAMINNSVFQIYRDSKNGIWISTWSGGLCYINEWSNNFEHIKREPNNNSLSDNVVTDFEENSNGDIIVATEDGHLNYFNRSNRKFTDSQIKGPNGIVNHIKSICIDRKGTLWIGTFANGIFFKPKGTTEYQKFNLISDFKDQFYDIAATDEGLWFASSLRGLFYYDYKTRGVKQFTCNNTDPESLSSNNIKTVLVDSEENIWVGTALGLNKKIKKSNRFTRYFYNPDENNRISSNSIYTLFEDSKKHIWIGTSGGGVTIYDSGSGIFSQLSKKDGLAGNDVYGILEDKAGTIWLSTENGLSAYTPSLNSFRNFDYADGLQGNQFNPGAAYKTKDGELLFGGSNGFTKFDPMQIKKNPVMPETYITGIEVNNQAVNQAENPELIRQSILTLDHLELNYDQNSLRLSFVANNFLLPPKARFRYRLIGYSSDWVEIENDNKAIFTKIPPGDYLFEVKATNNDDLWNEKPRQLVLTIKNPIWRTLYAYVLYLIVIFVVIYFVLRELKIRQKLKNSILQQKVQQENEEKLHQLKLNFFTNISHEFRTPLTLILSPLSLIKKKIAGQTESLEYLAMIENNANRLFRLVNQILDLRKIELGKMRFQPKPFDIVALCQEVFQCYAVPDNERKISFNFESDFSSLFMLVEPDKIDKMIFNLLSNALKYVREDGSISLMIKKSDYQPDHLPDEKHY